MKLSETRCVWLSDIDRASDANATTAMLETCWRRMTLAMESSVERRAASCASAIHRLLQAILHVFRRRMTFNGPAPERRSAERTESYVH